MTARLRQRAALRLSHEHMHMLRHDDARIYAHLMVPRTLESQFECAKRFDVVKVRPPPVTADGQEVRVMSLLKSFESPGHVESLASGIGCVCDE